MMDEELYREMIEEHEREEVESLQLLPDLKVSHRRAFIPPPPFSAEFGEVSDFFRENINDFLVFQISFLFFRIH